MKRVTADRILVIAQSVGDVRIIWEAISDHVPGTAVLWCWDVVSALALAQDLAMPPDVILLHNEVSSADAAEAVRHVRSLLTLAQVPIIVITNEHRLGDVSHSDLDMYFVKPFELAGWNALGKAIRGVLRPKSTRQQHSPRDLSVCSD